MTSRSPTTSPGLLRAVGVAAALVISMTAVAPAILSSSQAAAAYGTAAASLPIGRSATSSDDVRLAPAAGGRLFVAIRRPASTVVAGFDRGGRLLAGWPVTLDGWTDCWLGSVAGDGSIRLVCRNARESVRAFALDARGRRLAGWPVDVSAAAGRRFVDYDHFVNVGDEPRIVGSRLHILLQRWDVPQAYRLVRISARGGVAVGDKFVPPSTDCDLEWTHALGADGTAFAVRHRLEDWECPGGDSTKIFAFGLHGVRAGWPVAMDGLASLPTVGPRGRVYVVLQKSRSTARVRAFERDGTRVAGWSPLVPVLATSAWGGAGGFSPAPPVVAPDGSVRVVSGQGGTTVWALGAAGALRPGWPYRSSAVLTEQGACDRCSTGCGYLRVTPVVGPGGVLYLAEDPQSSTIGGRIIALARNASMQQGWPVALVRPSSRFRSIAVAADGTVYGLAIEVERQARQDGCLVDLTSATIVAIAPDGRVLYRRTVMAP